MIWVPRLIVSIFAILFFGNVCGLVEPFPPFSLQLKNLTDLDKKRQLIASQTD